MTRIRTWATEGTVRFGLPDKGLDHENRCSQPVLLNEETPQAVTWQ